MLAPAVKRSRVRTPPDAAPDTYTVGVTYPAPGPTPPPRRRPVVLPLFLAVVAGATLQVGVPVAVGSLLTPGSPVTLPGQTPTPLPRRTPSASPRPTPPQTTGPVTMTDALKRGVVLISGTTDSQNVAGTGMVLTASGEVLTNYHVVRSTKTITVTLASTGKTYDATLVGRDATKDVALLKLKGAQGLEVVALDNDPVNIGDIVIAAGNANGQGFVSANRGNILAMDQVIQVKGPTENDPAELLAGLIESDAAGWPGDSGGPMFDAQTEVLGMTTAGSSQKQQEERRVYAIPIAAAMRVVERVRAGDESGTVVIGPKAFLGVSATDEDGVKVLKVDAGTPAAKVGLRAGVRITALDGKPIGTRAELSTALDGYEPGATATIEWKTASGEARSGQVTFGESKLN